MLSAIIGHNSLLPIKIEANFYEHQRSIEEFILLQPIINEVVHTHLAISGRLPIMDYMFILEDSTGNQTTINYYGYSLAQATYKCRKFMSSDEVIWGILGESHPSYFNY